MIALVLVHLSLEQLHQCISHNHSGLWFLYLIAFKVKKCFPCISLEFLRIRCLSICLLSDQCAVAAGLWLHLLWIFQITWLYTIRSPRSHIFSKVNQPSSLMFLHSKSNSRPYWAWTASCNISVTVTHKPRIPSSAELRGISFCLSN